MGEGLDLNKVGDRLRGRGRESLERKGLRAMRLILRLRRG
jgi:hypothetical protein